MNNEDIIHPFDSNYLDELRRLHEGMRNQYYLRHNACPECGYTKTRQTYAGYVMDLANPEAYQDKNKAACNKCNWAGTVHDMVPAKRYELIATRWEYTPNSYTGEAEQRTETEVVATFDTKEMAEAYIKKSSLKKPKTNNWSSDNKFKAKSLLSGFTDTEIRICVEPESYPHNPTLN